MRPSYPLWTHHCLNGWSLDTLAIEPSEFSCLSRPHNSAVPVFLCSLSEDCGWNLTGKYFIGLEVEFWTELGITETQKGWGQVIDFKFCWTAKMHLLFEHHCFKKMPWFRMMWKCVCKYMCVCECIHMAPFPALKVLPWFTAFFPPRNNHHYGLN